MNSRKITRIVATAGLALLAVGGVSTAASATVTAPAAASTSTVIGKYRETFNINNNTGYPLRVSIQTNGDGSRNVTLQPGDTFTFENWTGKAREIFRFSGSAVDHPEIDFSGQVMYNSGQWCGLVFQPSQLHYEWQVHSEGAFLRLS
mgnify:FL=1